MPFAALQRAARMRTRALHTDEDETILAVKRPVMLNSIDDLPTRGDLVDRSVLINLPRISADKRRTEHELWTAFNAAHPRILGALLDARPALRRLDQVKLPELPRMSDFARWVTAAILDWTQVHSCGRTSGTSATPNWAFWKPRPSLRQSTAYYAISGRELRAICWNSST